VYYRFSEVMQRIFKYGDIQNTFLLLINSLTYRSIKRLLYVIIHRSYYTLLKRSVFGPSCMNLPYNMAATDR